MYILSRLNPLFEHLPVENMVYANQQKYYDAITASNNAANSGPFIDFMLHEIQKTLEAHKETTVYRVPNKVPNKLLKAFPDIQVMAWNVYALLSTNGYQTTTQMATTLGISDRMVRKHLTTLKEKGLIVSTGSNKTGHWEIVKT